MCGIAGYIGAQKIPHERVVACLGLMARRGPDAQGVYRHSFAPNRHVCMLHSRLSIIDLDERSNQPYSSQSQVLAFNGEIYNYLELKRELERTGYCCQTRSDTEILHASLAQDGVKTLDACEGMWAFAHYKEATGELLLSRDRFGEKPLYLYRDEEGVYFGSEVKFLMALVGKRFTVRMPQLQRYLVYGYKFLYKKEDTFFEGVRELPRACNLVLGPDRIESLEPYWSPSYNPVEGITYEESVEGAREALLRAMELRLRADVPLAFCMSGGVDSNSLICAAKRIFGYDVHGFTIVNSDQRYAEQDIVDQVVRELDLRHTAIPVDTSSFLEQMRDIVRYHDAPVYTISYYAHWLLMRSVAEQGYKVSISGTAADELFTGYYDHHAWYLYAMRNDPDFGSSLDNWNKHIKPIVRNPVLQDPEVFIKNPGERGHILLGAEEFAGRMNDEFHESFQEEAYSDCPLRNRMLNELFHESVPMILHEDDLNAMFFSVENRSPFLDRKLFEHCYSIPSRHLIGDGFNKKVLRDAMKGIVPDVVLDTRRKVGFNAPVHAFLDNRDPAVRASLLEDSPIFDVVNRNSMEAVLDRNNLSNSESKFLFSFVSSKMFMEEFC